MTRLLLGDALKRLMELKSDSVDSLVTDPPAGISFMGKEWDHGHGGTDNWIFFMRAIFKECFRVMKPGAHGLVWALPRTSHRTALSLERAGFEIRDVITHVFGSGFPKSLDVSKAIDKAAGAEREVVGFHSRSDLRKGKAGFRNLDGASEARGKIELTAPATDAAKQWQGFGTALKPASEHWILVRKPLGEKTVAKNVLKWGTGALNVDGSRIGMMTKSEIARSGKSTTGIFARGGIDWKESDRRPQGRFPANFVLSCCGEDPHDEDCAVGMLDEQSWPSWSNGIGASRFFYVAKPSRRERNEGCEGLTKRTISPADKWTTKDRRKGTARQPTEWRQEPQGNVHPTVKPLTLMRYLIRMVTPPRGLVLDPFLGSGTTGVAARAEGFCFIGIEKEKDYLKIARNRIAYQERKRAS